MNSEAAPTLLEVVITLLIAWFAIRRMAFAACGSASSARHRTYSRRSIARRLTTPLAVLLSFAVLLQLLLHGYLAAGLEHTWQTWLIVAVLILVAARLAPAFLAFLGVICLLALAAGCSTQTHPPCHAQSGPTDQELLRTGSMAPWFMERR